MPSSFSIRTTAMNPQEMNRELEIWENCNEDFHPAEAIPSDCNCGFTYQQPETEEYPWEEWGGRRIGNVPLGPPPALGSEEWVREAYKMTPCDGVKEHNNLHLFAAGMAYTNYRRQGHSIEDAKQMAAEFAANTMQNHVPNAPHIVQDHMRVE